jgi:hypothetical protein
MQGLAALIDTITVLYTITVLLCLFFLWMINMQQIRTFEQLFWVFFDYERGLSYNMNNETPPVPIGILQNSVCLS